MAAKRYSFVFYIAILVAVGATYAVFKVLESAKASSRVATAPVVIASRDINEGESIDRIAVSVAQRASPFSPASRWCQVVLLRKAPLRASSPRSARASAHSRYVSTTSQASPA